MTQYVAFSDDLRRKPSYRWIPWAFIGGMLLVVAVNGGLVFFAAKSWPGLTTDHAYNEGIAYNRVIDQEEKEAKLGWHLDIAFHPVPAVGGKVEITLRDAGGAPVDGATVTGEIIRPVEQMAQIPVEFVAQGQGMYIASVSVPRAGQWDIYLSAKRDGDVMHGGQRIVVPPK
jgi:nitrogen fixation protein FixH